MIIIGIAGGTGSGRTTVVRKIVNKKKIYLANLHQLKVKIQRLMNYS